MNESPEIFGKDADVRKIFLQANLIREKDRLELEWDGGKEYVVGCFWFG